MASSSKDMQVLGYIVEYRAKHPGRSLSLGEISRATNIPKTTVHSAVGRLNASDPQLITKTDRQPFSIQETEAGRAAWTAYQQNHPARAGREKDAD